MPSGPSREYWPARRMILERAADRGCRATAAQIGRLYDAALARIERRIKKIYGRFVEGYAVTPEEATRLLTTKQTREARRTLQAMLDRCTDKKLRAELLATIDAPAYASRISRLQALRDQVYFDAKAVAPTEITLGESHLQQLYKDSYYRNAFDLSQFAGHNVPFDVITDRRAAWAVHQYWAPSLEEVGSNFSERVWGNTTAFAEKARDIVTAGIMEGGDYPRMAEDLHRATGGVHYEKVIQPDGSARMVLRGEGAKYRATRVIRTEGNHITGQAVMDSYQAAGIQRYIFRALLELRTCGTCGALDGEDFLVSEQQPGINMHPMHPNCRCSTIPWESAEDLARAGRTRSAQIGVDKWDPVPKSMTYKEWYKKFVEGTKDSGRTKRRNKAKAEPLIQVTIEGWNSEQTRRRIGSQGQEIIDKPTFQKLTREFRRRGGIIIRGKDAERHLKKVGAYASYLPGANAAFIRDDATVSDVLEEMYHAEQERTAMFGSVQTPEVTLRREIDAQKHLLSLTERYKISLEEVAVTKSNLEMYEKRLDELLNGGE